MRTEEQFPNAVFRAEDAYLFEPSVTFEHACVPEEIPEPFFQSAPEHMLPAYTPSAMLLKRVMDIVVCVVFAPLLVLICGLIALLIKVTSPGPVVFAHRRIFKGGGYFYMWKFRTMCVNSAEVLDKYLAEHPEAHAEWVKNHKLRHDPRVTPLGRILRRLSLDELPQVWNVICGEMALVGPRPIVTSEVERYHNCFACYCHVKPGITGLWQVSGRSKLSYDERVHLDCKFVKEWSLWLEIKILFRTISCVVNSDGAF